MMKLRFMAGAVLVALGITGVSHAGTVTIKGSDTLVVLAQKWAEVYMASHPETKIQVTGGGSGIGFAALQNNTTDIANASRPIKPAERVASIKAFGKNPREYKVAMDGLSIYTHSANPVKELSVQQLKDIFTGRIRNWKEVGGNDGRITVYSRENSSGTYEFFKEHVLQGQDFMAGAQTMPGTAAVLQAVSKDPNSIGYGGAAYGHGAQVVAIKKDASSAAVTPSEKTVLDGSYPISRYLFNYLNPDKDKGEIAAYLRWIRSDAGQAIVQDVGYYPLPEKARAQ